MEEVGGVVAPEDLVCAINVLSGQHLPLAEVVAGGAAGDFLAGASDFDEGLATAEIE